LGDFVYFLKVLRMYALAAAAGILTGLAVIAYAKPEPVFASVVSLIVGLQAGLHMEALLRLLRRLTGFGTTKADVHEERTERAAHS
jgi:hypothetical protein